MSQIISLITAVVFLIATIISVIGDLPWWVILVAILLFVVSVAPAIYHRVSAAFIKYRYQRVEQELVEQHWGELKKLAVEMQQITESNRVEMASIICDLAHKAMPDKQNYYNPYGYKVEINLTLEAFLSLLESQVRNIKTFTSSAKVLENLLWLWHNDLVMRLSENLMRDLEVTKYEVNRYQKQNYSKFRKWHCDLMDDYVKFAKKVNEDFGAQVLRVTNYEPPPDL